MEGQNKNNPILTGIIIFLIVALAYGLFKFLRKNETVAQMNPTFEVSNNYLYRSGMYTSEGSYFSPGGEEKINLTVTLKDDIVTDAEVKSLATRPESIQWQKTFISGFKTQVIGKKINTINLTKVSGSSLTPIGFNNALDSIKASAQL